MSEMTVRLNVTENNQRDVIDQTNKQKNKVDVLWINLLDSKNLVAPILENNAHYRPVADIIRTPYVKNVTVENAIRNSIDEIDLNEAEFKRIAFDHIPNIPTYQPDIKLHPIDSNLKKVKTTVSPLSLLKGIIYILL